jgi:hypothetical protein
MLTPISTTAYEPSVSINGKGIELASGSPGLVCTTGELAVGESYTSTDNNIWFDSVQGAGEACLDTVVASTPTPTPTLTPTPTPSPTPIPETGEMNTGTSGEMGLGALLLLLGVSILVVGEVMKRRNGRDAT